MTSTLLIRDTRPAQLDVRRAQGGPTQTSLAYPSATTLRAMLSESERRMLGEIPIRRERAA